MNRSERRAAQQGKRAAVFSFCLSGGCGCGLPSPGDAPELASMFGIPVPTESDTAAKEEGAFGAADGLAQPRRTASAGAP